MDLFGEHSASSMTIHKLIEGLAKARGVDAVRREIPVNADNAQRAAS